MLLMLVDEVETELKYMKIVRYEALFLILLLFVKFTDILTIFDSISLFVFFMFIFCITIFMTSNCFYLIGRNQLFFDEITVKEYEETPIPYTDIRKAIWYIWLLTLGEFNYDCFWLGNANSSFYLIFVFCIATFMMIIHLLNMLIAIMGNTFENRNHIAHNIRTRDHLKFVIENWELNECFDNKEQYKYIVTAYKSNDLELDREEHIN